MKTIKQTAQKLKLSDSYTYVLIKKLLIKPREKNNRLHITEAQFKKLTQYMKKQREEKKQRQIIAKYRKDLTQVAAKRREIQKQVKAQRKTNRALKRTGKRQMNKIKKEMKTYERFCTRVIRDCKPDRKTRQMQKMEREYYGY